MKTAARLLLALCLAPVSSALAQEAAPAPAPVKPAPTPSGSAEQEAGDVSEVDKDRMGPLRERVSPVSGHLFLKKGRFEFSPSASLSLTDSFFTKYVFGATLTYHPLETLGLSLRAGYALSSVSGTAQICEFAGDDAGTRGCRLPTLEDLDKQAAPGHITLLGGVDAQWAPIYGKVSLLAEQFIHFDLYGIAGATAVQYRGPDQSSLMTVGGNVGVGMRFFVNRWVTLRTEFRDLIYVEKSVNPSQMLRNQLMFELGVSFFFPSAHPES
ncbi:outer membrane beta-barrel domain-containing protein [Archangium sp.]|uniref:outer membrane beta-barrel domain-containing protein n=1 Tax=Archangium sp. TaxID=1872627 RepID=UPI00286BD3F1|nr:outer membrane beta-barrel domain-containing protein [Archangium sp.]